MIKQILKLARRFSVEKLIVSVLNEQTDPNRLQAVPLPLCTPSRLIFAQTFQISSPIAVGVLVRSGINLIDDSVLPPLEILLRFGHAISCHGRTDDDQTGDE